MTEANVPQFYLGSNFDNSLVGQFEIDVLDYSFESEDGFSIKS